MSSSSPCSDAGAGVEADRLHPLRDRVRDPPDVAEQSARVADERVPGALGQHDVRPADAVGDGAEHGADVGEVGVDRRPRLDHLRPGWGDEDRDHSDDPADDDVDDAPEVGREVARSEGQDEHHRDRQLQLPDQPDRQSAGGEQRGEDREEHRPPRDGEVGDIEGRRRDAEPGAEHPLGQHAEGAERARLDDEQRRRRREDRQDRGREPHRYEVRDRGGDGDAQQHREAAETTGARLQRVARGRGRRPCCARACGQCSRCRWGARGVPLGRPGCHVGSLGHPHRETGGGTGPARRPWGPGPCARA